MHVKQTHTRQQLTKQTLVQCPQTGYWKKDPVFVGQVKQKCTSLGKFFFNSEQEKQNKELINKGNARLRESNMIFLRDTFGDINIGYLIGSVQQPYSWKNCWGWDNLTKYC